MSSRCSPPAPLHPPCSPLQNGRLLPFNMFNVAIQSPGLRVLATTPHVAVPICNNGGGPNEVVGVPNFMYESLATPASSASACLIQRQASFSTTLRFSLFNNIGVPPIGRYKISDVSSTATTGAVICIVVSSWGLQSPSTTWSV